MHDTDKESDTFRFLMPDATLKESLVGVDLIAKGLTADEAIEVIEKRRDEYDFKSALG